MFQVMRNYKFNVLQGTRLDRFLRIKSLIKFLVQTGTLACSWNASRKVRSNSVFTQSSLRKREFLSTVELISDLSASRADCVKAFVFKSCEVEVHNET
jgi:hypothetical protein